MIFAVHQMNASTAYTKTDISSIWRLFCYIICNDIEGKKIIQLNYTKNRGFQYHSIVWLRMTMTKVCKLPHVIPVFQSVHEVLSVNWWINNQQIYHIQSEVYFGSHLFDIGSGRLEWSVTSTIVKNLWTLGTQSVPLCHVTRPLTTLIS